MSTVGARDMKKKFSEEENNDDFLMAPFNYIRSKPGKQIRTKLIIAFNNWLKIDNRILDEIIEICDILHNASLMIDDIEDNSVLRRGLPVAHEVYGVAQTINTANYIYLYAVEKLLKLGHPKVTDVCIEQALEAHRGQGKEIFHRDSYICPTEAKYEKIVIQKTGSLFFLPVNLMQLFSLEKYDFNKIIKLLALFFQIRDDLMNLTSEDMAKQKTFAEDLTEGKFSFPIIHSLSKGDKDGDDTILNILRQRTQSNELKKYCIKVIKERGSFEYTLRRLSQISREIRNEIKSLGGNQDLIDVISSLEESLIALNNSYHSDFTISKDDMNLNGEARTDEYISEDDSEDEKHLLAPFDHIKSRTDIETQLTALKTINKWLLIDEQMLSKITEAVKMLLHSILMMDDIEDNSILRKGSPVAHSIFGIARTINTCNYFYFVVMKKVSKLGHPEAIKLFLEKFMERHRGQGKEIYWRDNNTCPTEEQYEQMGIGKTGAGLGIAIGLMQLFSDVRSNLDKFINLTALYLKIWDDYLNLASEKMEEQKSFADDISEGKFSFPIIHAIRQAGMNEDDEVWKILRQKTRDVEIRKRCVEIIKERGSFDYTQRRLTKLKYEIIQEIETLGDDSKVNEMVKFLENAFTDGQNVELKSDRELNNLDK